ncbi:MAG: 1,4-beta-xylanase [Cellulomonas sp. 73-92]|nr:MAG: 1,4-beta-xylanase [Cellulomonas sp. 73-92]
MVATVVALLALGACTGPAEPPPTSTSTEPVASEPRPSASPTVSLRTVAPKDLLIGSSVVGGGHLSGTDHPQPLESDAAYRQLLATQFATLTPENALKWASVEPARDTYDFAAGDAAVAFAEQHGEQVRGHNLMWHQSNPAWLTEGGFTPDQLRQILHDHISTVVGHYRGRIAAWDVANEIFDDYGRLQAGDPFTDALGVGIVADAFRWAHEADPAAVLYLNDYNVESSAAKRQAYLDLARQLLAQGVPLGGMGIQGHLSLQYPPFPPDFRSTLQAFADLGLDVAITELDVRMALTGGEATGDQLATQADWYRQAVAGCLAVARCVSVTMWGLPDTYSWVPATFTGQGAATPFIDDSTAKPAFDALVAALQAGRT